MEEHVEKKIREIIELALDRYSEAKAHQIGFAAMYAEKAHTGQTRKSGDTYIMHPLRVAEKLLKNPDRRIDDVTIIAALLHDVVEDTNKTLDTIHMQFGRDVANIVDSLTKRREGSQEEQDNKYVQQVIKAAHKDPRVGIIKLSDQIDNAKDLNVHTPQRKEYKVTNLKEVWVPLAEELKTPQFKQELQKAYEKYQE